MGRVTIGRDNHIFPGAVIGGHPQDISYRGTETQVVIGDGNVIREGVTINRASEKEDGVTSVGNHNFLMACCHIAHDCRLGNRIIMANAVLLGGHVRVHDHASLQRRCRRCTISQRLAVTRFIARAEPRAARCAPVHAVRRNAGPTAVHQRGGAEA